MSGDGIIEVDGSLIDASRVMYVEPSDDIAIVAVECGKLVDAIDAALGHALRLDDTPARRTPLRGDRGAEGNRKPQQRKRTRLFGMINEVERNIVVNIATALDRVTRVLDDMRYEAFCLCDSGIPPAIERGKLLAKWCDRLRAAMIPKQFISPTAGRAGSAETAEAKDAAVRPEVKR